MSSREFTATSMSLGEHFAAFVDAQVRDGRFGSAEDVVLAGLRLLEEHEKKVRALENALIDGERSGEARRFDDDAFRRRMQGAPAR